MIIDITCAFIFHMPYASVCRSLYFSVILGKKGEAIRVTGRGGLSGCETSRLPHFLYSRLTDGGEVVGLIRRPVALYPPGRYLVLISVRG
jgi:hypothetical protein